MSETETVTTFPEGFGDSIVWDHDENYNEPPPEEKARVYSDGLAAFAEWLRQHPEFTVEFMLPRWGDDHYMTRVVQLDSSYYKQGEWTDSPEGAVYVNGKYVDRSPQEMAAEMLRVRRLAGLKQKFATTSSTGFFMDFASVPGLVRLTVSMSRQVTCEMVDTGEVEEYTERRLVTPAVYEDVPSTKPILKRVCVDSLAALAHEEAAAES